MNLGEAKKRALSLMAEYSVNGVLIPERKNADYINRMNRFASDAQMEICDKVGIEASHIIEQIESSDSPFQKYPLPEDFKEHRYVNLNDVRFSGYRLENHQLWLRSGITGVFEHFYFKYPQELTSDTRDDYVFEVDRNTHPLIPYYMGAMSIHDENPSIADRLLNLYYGKLQSVYKISDEFPNFIRSDYSI